MKRLILFFMVISIIFTTACGTNTATSIDKEQEQFTYEAKEIYSTNGSKGISSAAMGNNGELAVYNYYEKKIHIFDKEGTKTGEIEAGENWDGALAFDKDNKLYVLLQSIEKNENKENVLLKRQLRIYDIQSNTLEEQSDIVEIKGDSKYLIGEVIDKIEADSQGNIYCLKVSEEVEILDKKLKNIAMLQGRQCLDIDLDEEGNILGLCYGSGSEAYIEKISGKTHKSIWKKSYNQTDMPESIYYNAENKTLYGLTPQGIASFNEEGSIKENIAERGQLGVLDNIFRFIVDEGKNIYVLGKSGNAQKIFKLTRTENNEESIGNKKEIVVYSYDPFTNYKNQQMINIVRKFEKEHPSVTVRLITINDIQQLNTELLAGKGPDVLCGYYPAREYIDKGILTDLSKFIDADKEFSIKDYDTVVIESSKHNNALNIIPISYSLKCYIGNKKLLADKRIDVNLNWTWKDFYKAITTDKSCYAIPQFEHDENYGLEDLIKDDADYYIDWNKRIARFDSKEFLAALKLLKSIKVKFMHPEADASRRDADNLSKLEEAVLFYPMYIGRYLDLNFFSRYPNGKIVLPSPKGEYSDAKTFKSFNASINDGSKNKEEAWKFVKYLLSEEIQFHISENDFVINKKADERRISEYLAKMKNINRLEESNVYVESLNIIRSSLNKNSALQAPDELFNTIWEEVKVYFSGGKSAEETAKTIQNKVELYLNE